MLYGIGNISKCDRFYHATKVPYFLTELTADSGSNAVSNTNTII